MRVELIQDAVDQLVTVFKSTPDKREAMRKASPLLEQISREPQFLTELLKRYIQTPGSLDRGNYPAVGIEVALTPWFGLTANCWIPHPERVTNLSTKAIHHHGPLLLNTVTIFGPGYEHWMFTTPEATDENGQLYRMELIEAAPHPKHHVAFVDANIPHTPFFPPELSVTLALFSNSRPAGMIDRIKRLPGVRGNEARLRGAAVKLGLLKALDLKVPDFYDFYPTENGFQVMASRDEFARGPNADHVASVFHTIQATGNDALAPVLREQLDKGTIGAGRATVERLLPDLEKGRLIEGRLSEFHYATPHANFTCQDIERALLAVASKDTHASQFPASADHQEAPRTVTA